MEANTASAVPPQFVATLTVDDLETRIRRVVRDTVREEVRELELAKKDEPPEDCGYMETAEAAAYLKVKPHTIPSLVKRDKIPHTRRGTGPKAPYLFKREDLISYLEERATHRGAHRQRHYETIARLKGGNAVG